MKFKIEISECTYRNLKQLWIPSGILCIWGIKFVIWRSCFVLFLTVRALLLWVENDAVCPWLVGNLCFMFCILHHQIQICFPPISLGSLTSFVSTRWLSSLLLPRLALRCFARHATQLGMLTSQPTSIAFSWKKVNVRGPGCQHAQCPRVACEACAVFEGCVLFRKRSCL